jgi:hypothetical protein|tara:strand:+ start:348 stop:596 length:249 start_codon:yes stop_codon:yes gene_type:complete
MKKQLLTERFQQLAGIKPLNEDNQNLDIEAQEELGKKLADIFKSSGGDVNEDIVGVTAYFWGELGLNSTGFQSVASDLSKRG